MSGIAFKKRDDKSTIRMVGSRNPHVPCGNIACRKCFPEFNAYLISKGLRAEVGQARRMVQP